MNPVFFNRCRKKAPGWQPGASFKPFSNDADYLVPKILSPASPKPGMM
jgi:hypothetical protein